MAMAPRHDEIQGNSHHGRQFAAGLLVWTSIPAVICLTIATHLVWTWQQPLDWAKIGDNYPGGWVPIGADGFIASPLNPFSGLDNRTAGYIHLIWVLAVPATVAPTLATAVWWRSRLAAGLCCVWLALITLYTLWAMVGVMAPATASFCFVACGPSSVAARQTAPGLWLTLVALSWLWGTAFVRLATLRVEAAPTQRIMLVDVRRALTSPARISALLFLAGILVWYFGFLFTPYATQGCSGFPINWAHFTIGSCSGFDANNAISLKTLAERTSKQPYNYDMFFVGLATLAALVAIWQRGWLALAISALLAGLTTPLTVAAVSGVPILLGSHPAVREASSGAPLVVGAGPAVTIAGTLILWLGVAALVAARISVWRQARG
jgi:hypothetical protein